MTPSGRLLENRRGLILGVANSRSLAWGIASACATHGAKIALTYQGEAIKRRVEPLAQDINAEFILPCDATSQNDLDKTFNEIQNRWDRLDFLVHAIAFSDKEQLMGRYINTTPENFAETMNVSCYSLTAIARRAEPLMTPGGSLLTLTYYGAEKVMPHYNVMGVAKAALEASVRYLAADMGRHQIRVNAISAGPIKTLAASGISDFRYILKWNEYNSPLRRTVSINEIGNAALYLLSDLGSATTGDVLHVDAGYHVVGMKNEDAPDLSPPAS